MTPAETTTFLRRYNEWRRTDDRHGLPYPDPREVGAAIDAAIAMIDRLEAAESDALEQARLNGMGSEREAALMARIEAAEKERDWNAERLEDAIEELTALRAKIEAKENALGDWLYANAPGGWIDNLRVRCDTLRAELKAAHAMALNGVEWRELAQKHESEISAMKRQAPAMWVNSANIVSARINRERGGIGDQHTCAETKTAYHDAPLYALPGARPAPSVPEAKP